MLVAVTWRLSQTEIALREAINTSRGDIEDKQDRMGREFGETVTAIRQKVHEIETWARDEFVRKGTSKTPWAGSKKCSAISSTALKSVWTGWKRRSTIR